jgi:hypothetical protein
MENKDFFSGLVPLNKLALSLFVVGKISGMVGVCLGFCDATYHLLGGIFLVAAFVFVFSAVGCSLVQLGHDKKRFDKEDQEHARLREIKNIKSNLEKEIKELQFQHEALKVMLFKRR